MAIHLQTDDIVRDLRKFLPKSEQIITDATEMLYWAKDWTKEFSPNPRLICFPENTEQVACVLRYCNEHNLAVVPSGGRTGLAAGALAKNQEIVLSLTRMNKILRVDRKAMLIEVEAGVTTQAVQEAAQEAGLFFPLDLAAKGSSHIAGNIATNAGGLKFIRYGGMREQVLGLEAVLADGSVLDCNSELRKNNTGYDLKQLLIGSEGTLGIITKATLRLVSAPQNHGLMCLGINRFEDLLAVLSFCHQKGLWLTAFEFFSENAHRLVLKNFPQKRSPFVNFYPYYALVEVEYQGGDDRNPLPEVFEQLFAQEIVADGILADSSEQFHELWELRELITESVAANCIVRKNDISVPIGKLPEFVKEMLAIYETREQKDIDLVLFGHIGDGNLHLNHIAPPTTDKEQFFTQVKILENKIFSLIKTFKGSISAEHGIGLIKKPDLAFSKSGLEIKIMKEIKHLLDTKNILNPGKIFD